MKTEFQDCVSWERSILSIKKGATMPGKTFPVWNEGETGTMREILYYYNTLGTYQTEDSTYLDQPEIRIIMRPHSFSLAIGGDVLRSSNCKGYQMIVSKKGAVTFYDQENNRIGVTEATHREFAEVLLHWKQNEVSLEFGKTEEVDYYPHCDGEYDRWGTAWRCEYKVTLDETTNKLSVCP